MALPDHQVLAALRERLQPGVFDALGETEISPPDPAKLFFGILQDSTLRIFEQGASLPAFHATLQQIEPTPGRTSDLGASMPNGFYVVASRAVPPATFAMLKMQREDGEFRYLLLPGRARANVTLQSGKDIGELLIGRGMLLYNNTDRPKPLFGFLSYEPNVRDARKWQFIDRCVNYARDRLIESRRELQGLIGSARSKDAPYQRMVGELRAKGRTYNALQRLRDFLNLLSYLRYLSLLPGFNVVGYLGLAGEPERQFTELVRVTIPKLEESLVDAGRRLTLNQMVERMDEALTRIRKSVPLLGRLSWQEVQLPDERLNDRILEVYGDLLADNQAAEQMVIDDYKEARRMLTLIPPRVMGIPRIVQFVEQRDRAEINADIDFFFAVQHLKSNAATFPIILGLYSAVFTFFCPPLGVALGLFSAALSVDEAVFKDFLSDADVNIDETFVTQAEAREAKFWAAVDVIFSVVDVAQLSEASRAVRGMRQAGALDALPGSVDELAEAGGRVAEDVREVERLAGATDRDALARASTEMDLQDARQTAAQAGASSRLQSPPPTAAEAIRQAERANPEIQRRLVGNVDVPGGEPITIRDLFQQEYTRHFNETMRQIDEARRAAQAVPPGPLDPNHFAVQLLDEHLQRRPRFTIDPPPRAGFYGDLAQRSNRQLGQLLEDADALREVLAERLRLGVPEGLNAFDRRFLGELAGAVHRGEPAAALDDIIRRRFLQPIDDLAGRVGLTGAAGREFGLFAHGVDNLSQWTDPDALRGLRSLFELGDARIDRGALHAMLNNRRYVEKATTKLLNQEVAKALSRIVDVEGVIGRVSLTNPSLFESLATGNRGHAFEAILVSRLLEPAQQAGAKIVVGRRWWLGVLDELNRVEGTRYANLLEADILIELQDGRRILIDAKFYERGIAITDELNSQLAKIASGIEEGIIHNGEYWVSHRFVQSRTGLTNLEAFQGWADLWSSGKIHIAFDVYEHGFPNNFFQSSRFRQVSRGEAILVPDYPGLGRPVTGPSPIPAPAPPTPDELAAELIPVPETVTLLAPARESESIRATAAVAPDRNRSLIPVSPLAASRRLVVVVEPIEPRAKDFVGEFLLVRSLPGQRLAQLLRGLQPRWLSAEEITRVAGQFQREQTCILGVPDDAARLVPAETRCPIESIPLGDPSGAVYALWVHRPPHRRGRAFVQAVLYDVEGRLLRRMPSQPDAVELRPGEATVIPFSARREESPYAYPFVAGARYRFGLRLTVDGRTSTDPRTIQFQVQIRPAQARSE
jgi:hypothetical protein